MNFIIFAAIFYVVLLPLILRLGCIAHKQVFIKNKQKNMPRNKMAAKTLPQPIWPKIKERLSFGFKDKRPFSFKKDAADGKLANRNVFFILWLVGLATALAGGFTGSWGLVFSSTLAFIFALSFAITKANPVLKKQALVYQKMFEVGKSTLGLSAENSDNPKAVIQVQEWRDVIKPVKVRYEVPTNFSADSEEAFLRQFNQIFGVETTWVAFAEDGKPGWDYEEGYVTLKETPPLPQMAPWDEHYVLSPSVAWSFFPIALGIEHGIELENPKTGEVENVLGFDVSGEQAGLSKKMGTYCSPTVTTSPMALAAGGTGGGKALAADTKVKVVHSAPRENTNSH